MTSWVDDAILWQLYPLGFVGADIRGSHLDPAGSHPDPAGPHPEHRLGAIVAWLDYAVELGASGLLLGPVFASQTHGYDTIDHFRIDPRLGDDDDFDALIGQCRQRGLRVVLDGVFNHVGRGHPAFVQVLERGAAAEHADWFVNNGDDGFATFEGHDALVTLNHSSAAVADLVGEVMIHWLDRSIDGWRLDAAYAVPAEFWRPVVQRVRAAHPDAYLFGEMIHGDYAGYVEASGLDSVTQYELWKAIWSSLNDRNLFELAWALERHAEFLETFVPQTFIGNHDVTRLATRLEQPHLLDHALLVLATIGGTPSIYAGDEQAFRGTKFDRVGGDDEVRPAFPDSPAELSELGEPTFRLHQQLLGIRRRHRWLFRAAPQVLHTANEQLLFRCDDPATEDVGLVVALNIADESAQLPIPPGLQVIAGSGEFAGSADEPMLTLPGGGWAVLAGS